MYCRNCGKEIKEGNSFCSHCGMQVTESESKGKSGKSIWILLFVAFLCLIIGIIAYIIHGKGVPIDEDRMPEAPESIQDTQIVEGDITKEAKEEDVQTKSDISNEARSGKEDTDTADRDREKDEETEIDDGSTKLLVGSPYDIELLEV